MIEKTCLRNGKSSLKETRQRRTNPLNILFWDIDGTLLRTNRAGLYAFQQAARELLGGEIDFNGIETSGMTDHYIADQVIRSITGQTPAHDDILRLVSRYEELLPAQLEIHQGYLLPSVRSILTELHDHPSFVSTLLTGNNPGGAKIKLSFFNIAHYFDFSLGAFSLQCRTRRDVADQAKRLLTDRYPDISFARVFVIGDTPHDVDCGKYIGAQTIAVATGTHSFANLRAHAPWWALETLPSPAEFIKKIETVK